MTPQRSPSSPSVLTILPAPAPSTPPLVGAETLQMNGLVLGLFRKADLAVDQGRPEAALGTGAITLAQPRPG